MAQTMTEPHILCTDLVRIFSADGVEVQALQGLDLRVDPGEMVAVVGASGSGKSTLLTILSGLDTATAGVARVAGHDLLTMRSRERVAYQRHTVGFVWQQTSRNLLPYLTAAENVALAMNVAGTHRGAARTQRVDELLDLLDVGGERDRRPGELSGGQQQRVAIAVALANGPLVLLGAVLIDAGRAEHLGRRAPIPDLHGAAHVARHGGVVRDDEGRHDCDAKHDGDVPVEHRGDECRAETAEQEDLFDDDGPAKEL